MGWYRGKPYGDDLPKEVERLRSEAQQHFKAARTYRRIGYEGHMVSENLAGIQCQKDADSLERDH